IVDHSPITFGCAEHRSTPPYLSECLYLDYEYLLTLLKIQVLEEPFYVHRVRYLSNDTVEQREVVYFGPVIDSVEFHDTLRGQHREFSGNSVEVKRDAREQAGVVRCNDQVGQRPEDRRRSPRAIAEWKSFDYFLIRYKCAVDRTGRYVVDRRDIYAPIIAVPQKVRRHCDGAAAHIRHVAGDKRRDTRCWTIKNRCLYGTRDVA